MTAPERVNILIVDDREANLLALETILKNPGLNIVKAKSGNDALASLLDIDFACVILDVQMPEMNGFELANIIRADPRTKYIPIIFASGHQQEQADIFKGYETGAIDYLLKPLEPVIVRSKVSVFAELYRKELARQRAEAALTEQAKELQRSNEELDRYASIVAHDLQAPLRRIGSSAAIFAKDYRGKLDGDGERLLRILTENAERMQSLINDVLTYSKVGKKLEISRIELTQVISGVLQDLSQLIEESGARVIYDDMPSITASSLEWRQLMQNLIGNAIKYRRKDIAPEIRVSAEKQAQGWLFKVSDNGIGIDLENREKLFILFSRLHDNKEYPGTGIGLAICKKIVARQGGKIWVESNAGMGSTFQFTLPNGEKKG